MENNEKRFKPKSLETSWVNMEKILFFELIVINLRVIIHIILLIKIF